VIHAPETLPLTLANVLGAFKDIMIFLTYCSHAVVLAGANLNIMGSSNSSSIECQSGNDDPGSGDAVILWRFPCVHWIQDGCHGWGR
jgi:hypothetical protein